MVAGVLSPFSGSAINQDFSRWRANLVQAGALNVRRRRCVVPGHHRRGRPPCATRLSPVGDGSADGSRSGPLGRASLVRHFGQSTKETERRKPSIHAGLRPVSAGQPSWRRGNNGKDAGCSRPRSSGDCGKLRERRRSTVMAISGNCGNRAGGISPRERGADRVAGLRAPTLRAQHLLGRFVVRHKRQLLGD